MVFTIRPARPDDTERINEFTRATFVWGDYVPEVFARWLETPGLRVLVAADESDLACAVSHGGMLGPREAWLGGMRVAAEHRRKGLAGRITDELLSWARDQGARVARLAIEDWNEPAQTQATGRGFRPVGRWVSASRAVGDAVPNLAGNGGKRVASAERLRPVPAMEADPGYLSWSSGDLARGTRELFPTRWEWRRLRLEDLQAAGERGALWAGRPGWAMAEVLRDAFTVTWVETVPENAYALARALVDATLDSDVERIELKLPRVDWLTQAVRRAGCSIDFELTVFARSL
jgi:GNAT superfamily N-acetyltransferase